MLKSVAHRFLTRVGLTAMRTHTHDTAQARARELEELVAALGALTRGHERTVAELRRDNARLTAEVTRLTADAARDRAAATRERDDRLALLDQLAQTRPTAAPSTAAPSTAAPSTAVAAPADHDHDATHWTRLGEEREAAGDVPGAVERYSRAMQLIHRFGPARERLRALARGFDQEAHDHRVAGRVVEEKRALVRSIELDPYHDGNREQLARLIAAEGRYDLTKQCWVYHDPARGRAVYHEAFLRACEYIAGSGVVGEFFEFGVLGGFTARLQCEIIRDLQLCRKVYLFDSFEGLPAYEPGPDQAGYDTAVRKVWADPMSFGEAFVREKLGCPVDVAIYARLTEVLGPDRVVVHRGFFSDTLCRLPAAKAALVHIDCDLYQSTVEVLTGLAERDMFQDGCVLLFDDWNCFRANPAFGERRAFREFLAARPRYTASPLYTYGWNGAAFILHDTAVGAGV